MSKIPIIKPNAVFVLIYAVIVSSLAVFFSSILYLSAILFFSSISLIIFGGFKFKKFLKVKGIIYIVIMISIFQSIFNTSGDVLVKIGEISIITTGGAFLGASVLLRMLIIISSGMIIATKKKSEIIKAMTTLKIPYELAVMSTLAARFIPMLSQEMKDSINAISLRGVRLDKISYRKRLKVYSYLLMPVISHTIKKADEISMAMENRGFRSDLIAKANNDIINTQSRREK